MQNTTSKNEISLSKGWYVIYTKSCHEKRVYDELIYQRYNSFLPLIKQTSIWSDRKKIIERPLFPSYVFVFLNNMFDYQKILYINGVVSFISFDNKLAVVKETEIEMIKIMIENCSEIKLVKQDIKIGEKYQIQSGPLTGYRCEVISIDGKNKLHIQINLLRQNIMAELNASYLIE